MIVVCIFKLVLYYNTSFRTFFKSIYIYTETANRRFTFL